jgi:hypothetical protein
MAKDGTKIEPVVGDEMTTPSDPFEPPFFKEAAQLRKIHRRLVGMGQTMIERMMEAGEILTRVKEGLPHGGWMAWVGIHLHELNYRTVVRYMRTYDRRDDPLLLKDPEQFMAEIYGNIGKLEAKLTSTSHLDTEPESIIAPAGQIEVKIEEVTAPGTIRVPVKISEEVIRSKAVGYVSPPTPILPPTQSRKDAADKGGPEQETKSRIAHDEAEQRIFEAWKVATKDQDQSACRHLAKMMVGLLFRLYPELQDEGFE